MNAIFAMGRPIFYCPLCCKKTFDSKQALAEHLSSVVNNLVCPTCNSTYLTLDRYIEHLNIDDCEQYTGQTIIFDNNYVENDDTPLQGTKSDTGQLHIEINQINDGLQSEAMKLENGEDNPVMANMYGDLLRKQLIKPIQCSDLKVVNDPGENQYMIEIDTELNVSGNVVTKQNNDGTISLTEKDLKSEDEPPRLVKTNDVELDENQEIYSCNTCGVSFTSVMEHIQLYHTDQEVVVEEPIEGGNEPMSLIVNEETIVDKHPSRRMITETGDIIEAPIPPNDEAINGQKLNAHDNSIKIVNLMSLKEVISKKPPVNSRQYVQIDKFCNRIVKDIKHTEDKPGPYHKVLVKEMCVGDNNEQIKVYQCMFCGTCATSLANFKNQPCQNSKYRCMQCPVVYDNAKSLCAHMKIHKSKSDKMKVNLSFECTVCNTKFPSGKSLKLHRRMHDPIKSVPIEGPVKSEGAPASSDKYMCPVCNKIIPIEYKTVHQNSHKSTNKVHCDVCNKKFGSKEYLEMHMKVHSMKVVVGKEDAGLPYNCLYCNRKFSRPHEKVKHERIHTGEKPHSCEICGKSFRVSYCLTLHMRTHTGARPYSCQHCGKRFKAHSVYNHHLLTHSEVRAYKCPYCPKAFKTSVQLAGHKNSHTKPFACNVCNRPFASLYAVRVHMEIHTRQNNLKYSCGMCGASYARAFALKDHIKQAHNQDIDAITIEPKEEEWAAGDTTDVEAEATQNMNKDMPPEINDLDASELIIP